MDRKELIQFITDYVESAPGNRVSEEDAIYPELAGMKIFESPLVGISSAGDELYFREFKKPGIIHPAHRTPEEWLSGAGSVISFFLPFTAEVCASNLERTDIPYDPALHNQRSSAQWLHARIEGQKLIRGLCDAICAYLQARGLRGIAPAFSPEFTMPEAYVSNWSERHVAYASGLGTFGLSRGLITEKGMAGRFGSVVTDAVLEPTPRPYDDPFAYCIRCGACQRRCPAGAIDLCRGVARGKEQTICGPYVNGSFLPPHGPNGVVRYGCGKCQAGVPCQSRNPSGKAGGISGL